LLFNSINYLFFFPAVVTLFYLLPQRFRWILLLAGSYFFYMCWNPFFITLIVSSTVVSYFAGLLMGKKKEGIKTLTYLPTSGGFRGVDLDRFFYKEDSHWTEEAVESTANDILRLMYP
jgi:hypothetical protein